MRATFIALLGVLAATAAHAGEDFEQWRKLCHDHSNWFNEHVPPGVANPPPHWEGDWQQACTAMEARAKAARDAALAAKPALDLKALQDANAGATP